MRKPVPTWTSSTIPVVTFSSPSNPKKSTFTSYPRIPVNVMSKTSPCSGTPTHRVCTHAPLSTTSKTFVGPWMPSSMNLPLSSTVSPENAVPSSASATMRAPESGTPSLSLRRSPHIACEFVPAVNAVAYCSNRPQRITGRPRRFTRVAAEEIASRLASQASVSSCSVRNENDGESPVMISTIREVSSPAFRTPAG